MNPLTLAYSPCPNDTYIFHAWVRGLLSGAPPVTESLHDIDSLNELALAGKPDIAKVSFHALSRLRDRYALLRSGGALGRSAGPLLVAPATSPLAPLRGGELKKALAREPVFVPGALTTASLLFRLFVGSAGVTRVLSYDRIMPAVASGQAAAGVIIHESRFTYPLHGLHCLADLGEWWEEETGYPVPLGGIVVRRGLGAETAAVVEQAVRASLRYAREHPDASEEYVRTHAQEMDPDVCREHIDLYVSAFSEDYGAEGEAAIRYLLDTTVRLGLAPPSDTPLFWDEG